VSDLRALPSAERHRLLRTVMGRFATGVVVVTAVTADPGAVPVGFTCQSFVSLSLEPPLALLCAGRSSTTWPRVRAAGRLCVNVLAADQAGLGQRFARTGIDRFAGVAWERSPNGSPRLGGVLAWVDATVESEVDTGDHTVVVLRVTGLGADAGPGHPLLYYQGGFGRLAASPA
jgi:flavin reductase (DIM6/NTAB) family NADH-FMN oxidoreductase RutF